jgi:hypothetical protein
LGNLWQRDERVLRWVLTDYRRAGHGYDFEYETNPPEPVPELDGMLSTDLHASLWRLLQYGLINGDVPACPNCPVCGTSALVGDMLPPTYARTPKSWSRLRPRAFGLIALGEWPGLDRIMSAEGIRAVLDALATLAPRALARREWSRMTMQAREEVASRLRTAAGLVEQLGDDVLRATMASVAAWPAMQSWNDAKTVWRGRDLQVLQLFARPGTIHIDGGFTLSDARLRELGVDLTFDEMLEAIHALADLGYLDGHGWVEGDLAAFPRGVTVVYRHLFVTGRGMRALGEWPSFTDLTPTTLAALLERLADETADQAQAAETRAAAWDIRTVCHGLVDAGVRVATAAVARQPPDL